MWKGYSGSLLSKFCNREEKENPLEKEWMNELITGRNERAIARLTTLYSSNWMNVRIWILCLSFFFFLINKIWILCLSHLKSRFYIYIYSMPISYPRVIPQIFFLFLLPSINNIPSNTLPFPTQSGAFLSSPLLSSPILFDSLSVFFFWS